MKQVLEFVCGFGSVKIFMKCYGKQFRNKPFQRRFKQEINVPTEAFQLIAGHLPITNRFAEFQCKLAGPDKIVQREIDGILLVVGGVQISCFLAITLITAVTACPYRYPNGSTNKRYPLANQRPQ